MKQKTLGVSVDIFASPSEGDFQSQLQLFEDLSNKITKVSAFAPLSSVESGHACRPRMEKRHLSGYLDEKSTWISEKAGGNVELLSPPITLLSGRRRVVHY
ncbi:D-allose transporter subunit [Escherichia coli]|uniref:D-allose transporter subunit n=1 Tax=Escherichia coli TaxID=562 RepID=A0A377CEK2_ECOLX|nr:D-allose transporter subunit [Escherichia coli]